MVGRRRPRPGGVESRSLGRESGMAPAFMGPEQTGLRLEAKTCMVLLACILSFEEKYFPMVPHLGTAATPPLSTLLSNISKTCEWFSIP